MRLEEIRDITRQVDKITSALRSAAQPLFESGETVDACRLAYGFGVVESMLSALQSDLAEYPEMVQIAYGARKDPELPAEEASSESVSMCKCPTCGQIAALKISGVYSRMPDYCRQCGQPLAWDVTEQEALRRERHEEAMKRTPEAKLLHAIFHNDEPEEEAEEEPKEEKPAEPERPLKSEDGADLAYVAAGTLPEGGTLPPTKEVRAPGPKSGSTEPKRRGRPRKTQENTAGRGQ